jgi:hypothetical protein
MEFRGKATAAGPIHLWRKVEVRTAAVSVSVVSAVSRPTIRGILGSRGSQLGAETEMRTLGAVGVSLLQQVLYIFLGHYLFG